MLWTQLEVNIQQKIEIKYIYQLWSKEQAKEINEKGGVLLGLLSRSLPLLWEFRLGVLQKMAGDGLLILNQFEYPRFFKFHCLTPNMCIFDSSCPIHYCLHVRLKPGFSLVTNNWHSSLTLWKLTASATKKHQQICLSALWDPSQ